MLYDITVPVAEEVVLLGAPIVYAQPPFWCHSGYRQLRISLLRQRSHFSFDPPVEKQPVIVFLCGGGWTADDPGVWMPELTYFAKRGYAVAGVEYSASIQVRFPGQLAEIRQALRFLRAHADELRLDMDRVAVMGESAGGHLAALTALCKEEEPFDTGEYDAFSSAVRCAVVYYAPVDLLDREGRGDPASYKDKPSFAMRGNFSTQELLLWQKNLWENPARAAEGDPRSYIRPDAPPFMLLYGTEDFHVHIHNGDVLYKALTEVGVSTEYWRIAGARHGEASFFQPEMKERVLAFLNANLNRN